MHLAKTRFSSQQRSVNPASSTLRRGLKTIIQLSGSVASSCRTASRMRRLIRLRTTDFPSARGVVKPILEVCGQISILRQKATKKRLVRREPRLYVSRNSELRRTRLSLGSDSGRTNLRITSNRAQLLHRSPSVCDGPWLGDATARRGHQPSSCAREIHGP